MKVPWQHHGREKDTWEPEATMKAQYPQLFSSGNNFEDEILVKGGGGGGGGGELKHPKIYPHGFITCLGYKIS